MRNRREFVKGGAALAASALVLGRARAAAKPRIVIVGGGAGGISLARQLSGDALDVTLIEAQPVYTPCFHSNLYLGGILPQERFRFGYDAVKALPGVRMVIGAAEAIAREERTVRLKSGGKVPYDYLVLSPGIDLDYTSVPGWSKEVEERLPHGWKGGAQLDLLKRQLDAVPDGGLIVIIAPALPYRCPPGPYERASMMAWALTRAGKTGARIVILDAKESFTKQPLFHSGWQQHYPGMVEWLPPSIHGGIKRVDAATMTVETDFETHTSAALINVIPRQTAGKIALSAGLTDAQGYCPIDPFTMKSRLDPRIFVIGDACVPGDIPKSADAANSQALVASAAITAELAGKAASGQEFHNTCWSLITKDDCVKIGGTYRPTPEKIAAASSFVSQLDEPQELRRANAAEGEAWYAGLTAHLFG